MKRSIKKYLAIFSLAAFLTVSIAPAVQAQCPMCRMSAESNLKNGGTDGKGLNAGILYMLATPYLLVGAIGLYWYRNRRKNGEAEE